MKSKLDLIDSASLIRAVSLCFQSLCSFNCCSFIVINW